jgi:F-box protein 8
MGQVLRRVQELEREVGHVHKHDIIPCQFPDLAQLPPEVGLLVLSHLNATDLCLAACVWQDLGNDDILWHSLCRSQWQSVSIYNKPHSSDFLYRKLYMQLDEATLTFNADTKLGLDYLIKHGLVDNSPIEIAKFIHTCRHIDLEKKREFLAERQDVLDEIVKLQNFENQFLPNALRKFFRETIPPNERNNYLSDLVKKFSERFCTCNPQLRLTQDTVYIVCFSLIMLSVDLTSPHVKNKMSKREFIRNTRRAANGINDEFVGHLYDNVYLVGHVAPKV